MQDGVRWLDEQDLALINALQLHPRASWSVLGATLGVDPVTVARRWSRLSARGEAWVALSPGPRLFERVCVAFVEIDCPLGDAPQVVRALNDRPHLLTIERAAGGYDLLATVATADLAAMSRLTLDVLPTVPGVSAVRARIVTHMFTEGGRWRIDALAPGQRAQLTATTAPPATGERQRRTVPTTAADRAILDRLAHDGRASYRALAAALDTSASTVKRRVDRLVGLGLLRLRCDFARPLGGWPVAVTFWAKVPPADLPDIGHAVMRLPQTRNCAAVSGPNNLVVQASLHALADVPRFETRLAAVHPAVDIAERVITLRHEKLLGRLLDAHGRSVGVVPPDLWSEPESPASPSTGISGPRG
ncbi:AsnC family transcriptional regulator [Streptomyces yokosukanensis]|uniref:AsnC family transcriptional regulator n=1 Tax=Streptomyces yokosukanensis TaxID=67386 RepID=A0A101NVM9_9ACTN|nr:AsnC family transcriptional regulator [Streptomyces yokosukanensis]KUN00182.1 AsnC family transcriptional regulator [Streptomyces yokosukanensis]